ncbi:MAG: M12 family metallo-peptidase [Phycisphaerales bacterium]
MLSLALTIASTSLLPSLTPTPAAPPSRPQVSSTTPAMGADPRTLATPAARPIDRGEFAALTSGAPAATITIDLPLHGCVEVRVVRQPLVTNDFRLEAAQMVRGATGAPVPASRAIKPQLPNAYSGTVTGFDDAVVYLGFGTGAAEGMVAGFIEIGDETWWLSSGSEAARRSGLPAMIAHESSMAGQPMDGTRCGAMDLARNVKQGLEGGAPGGGEGGVAGGTGCREYRIAIDTDTEFTMSAHGGNTVAASQYALLLMGAASTVYDRDLNCRLPVSYLRLWTGEDPWTQTEMGAQLGQYRDFWVANMGGVAKDLGHHLNGRGLGGGVAWVGVACMWQEWAYALSSGIGYGFPYPLIDHDHGNWEPMVVNHEIGHNFGAPHTHDHTPPADGCGLGDCTLAYEGTIMSYCHGCAGGMSNVSLKFHEYSINSINAHLAGTGCGDAGAFAVDDALSTLENTGASLAPLANDAFVNCSTLTLASWDSTSTAGGSIVIAPTQPGEPPVLGYLPPSGFSGSDSFKYTAVDPNGVSTTATVYVTVRPVLDRIYLDGAAPGVPTSWYALAGDTPALPDFATLTSYGGTVLANIDIPSTGGNFSTSGRADLVAAVFEGYIEVPATGLWTFSTESDDGSRMYIDGQLLVNNDGLHGMVDRSGQIALEAGFHRYRVEFFENFGGAGEVVRWQGPGVARAVIPATAFIKGGTVMALDLNGDGEVGAADLATLLSAWGPVAAGTPADFDRNGVVNAADLARVLANWGP